MRDAIHIINELRAYDLEREWFEFKVNWYKADELGEYISALSNSAAWEGKQQGYFVWGIDDVTHEIKGTDFNCNQNVRNEPLKHIWQDGSARISILYLRRYGLKKRN